VQDSSGTAWFTRAELALHDGKDDSKPLLLSIGGEVFDVTFESRFYGPGSGYAVFAARDATRALTRTSLDSKDYDGAGALRVDDFTEQDWDRFVEQLQFYRDKYKLVGGLSDGAAIPVGVARRAGGVCLQAAMKHV